MAMQSKVRGAYRPHHNDVRVWIDSSVSLIGGIWIDFSPDLRIKDQHGAADLLTPTTVDYMIAHATTLYRAHGAIC